MSERLASATATPSAQPAWSRLRRFAIDAAITAVINLAIALFITYGLRLHDSLLDNIVISMCIGTLMLTFIDGGRLLLWGLGKPPRLPFALLFAISVPAALTLGNWLASLLTGIPSEQIAAARAANPTGFFMMFLFVCAAVTWFFWNRARLEMLKADAEAGKARAAAIEKQALQAQLQLLQAQIEPHMLFNTLANLQGLIAIDAPRAQQMLDRLIHYLRATLSAARAPATTLAQEFALLDAYLGLMQVRMGPRLGFTLDLPDALREVALPPMLLQPLVENAVKHGLEPRREGGRIDVHARRQEDRLELCVADTGLGLDGSRRQDDAPGRENGSGVGLANVRERLQALYGDAAALALEPNQPCGLRATLVIPL